MLALLAALFLPVLLSVLLCGVFLAAIRVEPAGLEHECAGFMAGRSIGFHRRFDGSRFFLRQRRAGEATGGCLLYTSDAADDSVLV